MTSIQIRVDASQAASIARWVLDGEGKKRIVSDACVVKALWALASKRGVKVEFYAMDEGLNQKQLDLTGVKRVLEGGKP